MEIKTDFKMKILVTISYLFVVLINTLATLDVINKRSAIEISNLYKNLFSLSSITFPMWPIIYLLLALFVIYQWSSEDLTSFTEEKINHLRRLFVTASFLNALWIILWQFMQIDLSMIVMSLLFINVLFIKRLLKHHPFYSLKEKLIAKGGFNIYFSWLFVELLENLSSFFVSKKWDFYLEHQVDFTIFFLLIGAIFATYIIIEYTDYFCGGTFVWSYGGILMQHLSKRGWNHQYPTVILVLFFCMTFLLVIMVYLYIKGRRKNSNKITA